ncbi:hypothetical protein [Desulfobulbus sp.]|uniref:hypothetical protein n=1 Tax=Desulfobulbus sp. TaxID=895 RepID=UPI0027BAED01|nr:hypothetical protein [Desulfobulbus sp.]
MSKDLVGLISSWVILLIPIVISQNYFGKLGRLVQLGFILTFYGSMGYVLIYFFQIPIFLKRSIVEGGKGAYLHAHIAIFGILILFLGYILKKIK